MESWCLPLSPSRFCSLIDGSCWSGTVLELEAFSDQLPQSLWQCYQVRWDDGASDRLSPWDMEPLPNSPEEERASGESFLTSQSSSSLPSTPRSFPPVIGARLLSLLVGSDAEEVELWGGKGEKQRIQQGLSVVMEMDEASMFVEPVDLEELPTYCLAVPFPTDLSTIGERLGHGFYRHVAVC